MIEAHFTQSTKARPATIQTAITVNGSRQWSAFQHVVASKRAARDLCLALGAKPWNF